MSDIAVFVFVRNKAFQIRPVCYKKLLGVLMQMWLVYDVPDLIPHSFALVFYSVVFNVL